MVLQIVDPIGWRQVTGRNGLQAHTRLCRLLRPAQRHIYVCLYVCVFVCAHIHIYVPHVCMCIHIRIYTHTYIYEDLYKRIFRTHAHNSDSHPPAHAGHSRGPGAGAACCRVLGTLVCVSVTQQSQHQIEFNQPRLVNACCQVVTSLTWGCRCGRVSAWALLFLRKAAVSQALALEPAPESIWACVYAHTVAPQAEVSNNCARSFPQFNLHVQSSQTKLSHFNSVF